ncbi:MULTISPECIES: O-succinylhomoserine sulfhydrylase [unclassified Polaromonas]|jgi:O-succinylhomoserine sulfhydrylase|uniref:O-succinylhomoserine sulfhydrylase n=1 Tax=unclassified Polaromonas TaxID=2638319 RepID=UPI0025F42E42|nr:MULTISPECIES: O-succinylhomoserine sulfhydrylase [unclassified Polaromonas]HQS01291.1 O-succinylhomoserine sulfhydrylase [Polaromonas sp.]HQS42096.1 O-succinylhomoserine sulfhydrylase [Polaromonas sp.]HQS87539.1 O-succinylhomoserine sulfhydrylase [Polaromonas sp.]HQT09702.1 O-succinylhomoserine sulfhydrylase [Polaromonas sp.]
MADRKLPDNLHRDTLAVRVALESSQYGEHSEALYLTSGFVQPDAETAARRFAGTEDGYTYGRTSNPTVSSFERRLAALEGTEAAIGASTGMGAILMMCMGLLKAGDHVVCSRSMFGSTLTLIGREFGKFGVETTFVSQTDVAEWKAAIKPNTKLLFAETPTNPLTDVCDIAALADLAHGAGALLAVDNCFCTPALQRPAELGADLVIHSGTKYLDGQGRVMAGAICGPSKLIVDVFGPVVRTAGMTLSPFNAWVVLKGLETLGIRMQAQCANALAVARWLEAQPGVARVYYPGLASHPQHELAMRQQSGQGGAVVSFDVVGSDPDTARANAFHVINSTRVLSIATNLGDTKTIITHPGTTSHGRLTEVQRQAAGIGQGLIRVAVGLEHIEDIKADLLRGLGTLT